VLIAERLICVGFMDKDVADTAGFAVFSGCEPIAYPDLLEELPERVRRLLPTKIGKLTLEVAGKIKAIEWD
jgi:hypothetical protein